MYDSLIRFIREYFGTTEFIPLHAPVFAGKEREYVNATLESTFVSSVGAFVDQFENRMAAFTGSERAVATVNGTAALHMALLLADVRPGDLVVTQPLTFVATCNAIAYCGAEPVFVDVDLHTMGLSPNALESWLSQHAYRDVDGQCRAKANDKIIKACLPMHTFGHPVELDTLIECCARWGLTLVEDAAESLGSLYKGRHTGTFGALGTLSFNGNKVITTGGGGMILTDAQIGARAKHLTTTAKLSHAYEFRHDEVGYNYRLPNLNAALGCAQLEQLDHFIAVKRQLAAFYERELDGSGLVFFKEPPECRSNYWLNAVICEGAEQRDELLKATNAQNVMTRPIWALMNKLPAYAACLKGDLSNAEWLEARVVNLPSSVVPSAIV
ncbi:MULTISPECIES: LegC family aminotransferase [unclassified Pseudomonas]|uniref:LegC family aminotransferase n=1 Tax=unclassified Pseudomonas TaxID=196821 RepID=UPI000876FD2A|nr:MULTISPECIES: LegC family aminotransferase [unclassified Pseudomonas]SCZ27900.1 aminotransferase, LLPSF_NHT_00031 family [Pseudomonas sp. NFACC44-2]SDA75623.1 aminotransferase, LLPSF_NHT_00031 family [Pseudomonas sp. NFACC51]SEJ30851.1 aminotransferase, LLPSF_NHT_00031 family [Pseudomonas sp. NFACC07-1]SFH43787.1 aminotransferase, LLPSF_NHT_00031 family [Pseudomonas sp. NFACC54]SFT15297.1 aminotransferase, LLPSF_NHT_00031 family [Pseudomonas sp. NFACC48-1]